jgi:glycosyltransferase involved in cell wall biosynthesis
MPVRNGAATIGAQLDALLGQLDPGTSWELVVADNGSTDDTAAIVAAHPLGCRVPVRLVGAGELRGINVARNAAVASARGELVVFCDADDEVRQGWLAAYAAALLGGPPSTAAGPMDVSRINGRRQATWGIPRAEPHRLGGGIRCGWGGNMALHREVWAAIGGFDESYRDGFDEVEFFARAHEAGVPFLWVPDATVDYRVKPRSWPNLTKAFRSGVAKTRFGRAHPAAVRRPPVATLCRQVLGDLRNGLWGLCSGRGAGDWRRAAHGSGEMVGWITPESRLGRRRRTTGR